MLVNPGDIGLALDTQSSPPLVFSSLAVFSPFRAGLASAPGS
jgi:hypothetical protein